MVLVELYSNSQFEGQEFTIDQQEGIREIFEPEGKNRITVSKDGITHSAGPTVSFERDNQDRIIKITAPDGKTLQYAYNDKGDLISFTNRAAETTTYSYLANVNLPHYLEDITDPRGVRVARNEYDDNGRLIAHIDADGNRIEYTHDIEGRVETIKNRLGNSTTYVYDERGNILSETNAEGETTTHVYDDNGNELSRSDALGNTTTWTYDNIGNQLTESDPLGNTTSSSYQVFNQFDTQTDALGRTVIDNTYKNQEVLGNPIAPGPLTKITDALGNTIFMTYGAGGITRITDVGGNTTRTEYNSAGFITATINALGVRTDYTVDSMGNRLTETTKYTDADGIEQTLVTTHSYDAKGNLIQTTDPLGNITKTTYNAINKVTSETDANGNTTTYAYDNQGNKISTSYPDGSTESITYDAENNKLSETDRLGRTTHYVYDKINRLIETILPDATPSDLTDNPRTKTEYDAAGNQISFTDANGNKTQYEYDALDRRTKTTFADGTSKSVAYDALGRKISQTDQAGNTTQYAYDALGRLTKVTDAQSNETSYTYNEQGNKTSQTDAEGRITKWAYDKLGRVISRILPLGQVETMAYDANGNVTSKTDFNGKTTTYVYDSNNRLTKTTYADGEVDEVVYDAVGNRTQATITDNNGTRSYSYQYDSQNRLIKETQADGTELEYAYDKGGNRTMVKTTVDTTVDMVNYAYDALNRLTSTTEDSKATQYSYDSNSNQLTVTYDNGDITSKTYDKLNRITKTETKDGAGNVIASFSYTLDNIGNRTKVIENNGAETTYGYDSLYRLTDVTISNHPVFGNRTTNFVYDKVGNKTQQTVDGISTSFSYDDNDRLTNKGSTVYSYDNNGNTLSVSGNSATTLYQYNAKDKLVEAIKTDSGTAIDNVMYQYDIDGIRTQKTDDGVITHYLVDKNRPYAQVLKELDDTKQIITSYLYGDDLIKQTKASNDNYYLYDAHGSVRALSDANGSVTDTFDYSAYGIVIDRTGATDNSYLYAGEQFDRNLEQYYLRARYYDPLRGFTQMDSWMGKEDIPLSLNKYLYTLADPVNHIDPSGFFGLGDISAALSVRGIQSSLATGSYRVTFKKVAGKVACLAIEEGATMVLEETLTSGIYIALDGDKPYVGRSKDIEKRFKQHLRNTQRNITEILAKFHFEYDVKDQRLVEQFLIDIFESTDPNKGTNKINSIAKNPTTTRNKGLREIFDKMKLCK